MTVPHPRSDDTASEIGDSRPTGVINSVLGRAGALVQVGVVHGDVTLHAAPLPPASVPPRQLPAAPDQFAGREGELAALDRALTPLRPGTGTRQPIPGGSVLVSAVGGAGGIGKTWLALTWAHRHLDRFPEGQLFVDLQGFSPTGEPVAPAVAVHGFLDALGVHPDRIPRDLDVQAALYRSLVAGRRMLIMLDNAATSDQVVPLLPGSPTCTVLVTSRHRLASLIDRHGARHLPLGVLTRGEALALLTNRLGTGRISAEPNAVDDLIELCGGHSLALSIIARTADTRPDTPLAEVAAELREFGLEVLDHDTDPAASLPTVLSWSLRHLSEPQRTTFTLLGIALGPDTTPPATAALTGLPSGSARRVLAALEEKSLLDRRSGSRYAMHDLVRAYATAIATDLPDEVRKTALLRARNFYLHTAHAADRVLDPLGPLVHREPPAPGVHSPSFPDAESAMAWFGTEHATLLATQRAAAALSHHHVVWQLAWTLDVFHTRRGHLRDALASWRAAMEAVEHLPDPVIHSRTHRLLGRAYSRAGLHEEAVEHLDHALALATHHSETSEQALVHQELTSAWGRLGDDRRALDHARYALDLFHGLDLPVWEADALNSVGRHAAHLGEYDIARTHCHTALALNRRHRWPTGEADTLDSLGLIAHRTGDHRQALGHYDQAVTLYRALGHTYRLATSLDRLGHSHIALGHREQAHGLWKEALELYRDQGRDTDADRVQRQLDDRTGLLQGRPRPVAGGDAEHR